MLKSLSLSLSFPSVSFSDVTPLARLKNPPRVNRGGARSVLFRVAPTSPSGAGYERSQSALSIKRTGRLSDPSVRAPNEFQLIQLSAVLISSAGRFHQRISPALVFGDPLMAKCRNVAFVQADGRSRTGEKARGGERKDADRSSDADGSA